MAAMRKFGCVAALGEVGEPGEAKEISSPPAITSLASPRTSGEVEEDAKDMVRGESGLTGVAALVLCSRWP
jgi:hypothetical protein